MNDALKKAITEMSDEELSSVLSMMKEEMRARKDKAARVKSLQALECLYKCSKQEYGISREEIISASRREEVVIVRHVIFAILFEEGIQVGMIGRRMRRDHTTITHGINRVQEALKMKKGWEDYVEVYTTLKALYDARKWSYDGK